MADKKISSTELVEMDEFILKNNFFEFETKITKFFFFFYFFIFYLLYLALA